MRTRGRDDARTSAKVYVLWLENKVRNFPISYGRNNFKPERLSNTVYSTFGINWSIDADLTDLVENSYKQIVKNEDSSYTWQLRKFRHALQRFCFICTKIFLSSRFTAANDSLKHCYRLSKIAEIEHRVRYSTYATALALLEKYLVPVLPFIWYVIPHYQVKTNLA